MAIGVIFDMDGVLIDSEAHWPRHENALIRDYVPHWNEEDRPKLIGLSPRGVYQFLATTYGLSADEQEFVESYDHIAQDIYSREVSLLPEVRPYLEHLEKKGILRGLASSSRRRWVDIVLRRFELIDLIPAVANCDDTGGKGKPFPNVYLVATRLLSLTPCRCYAIEDSRLGVQAAKTAGLTAVGLLNGLNTIEDLSGADRVVSSFWEIVL